MLYFPISPHPWSQTHRGRYTEIWLETWKNKEQVRVPSPSFLMPHVSMEIKDIQAFGKEPDITDKYPRSLPPLNPIIFKWSETNFIMPPVIY